MNDAFLFIQLILLLALVIGAGRVAQAATHEDRLGAIQFMGTTAAALVMVMSMTARLPRLLDLALVLAALAIVAVVALTRSADQHENANDADR